MQHVLPFVLLLVGLQLIKPVEMCNPKVDELSMMTYLSQFPHCKLKPGAPLRPKTNPARVRAYGPGKVYYRNPGFTSYMLPENIDLIFVDGVLGV